MPVVVVSPSNVAGFPEGGGHFWVYMQYVQGLRRVGCEVYWLEEFRGSGNLARDQRTLSSFFARMESYGLGDRAILYRAPVAEHEGHASFDTLGMAPDRADAVFRRADLLLNFHYAIAPELLERFRRTALVDIDPGLLQLWMATGQLQVARHDRYLTIGETVGTPGARFPDHGLPWIHFRPPVCLDLWPPSPAHHEAFTTVSGWWGGNGSGEWVTDLDGGFYQNNKRDSFLEFLELPRMTRQPLELALCLGPGRAEPPRKKPTPAPRPDDLADASNYRGDRVDRDLLESRGWRIRNALEVAGSPECYRTYLQGSRGEFSCAKPSCMRLANAWVSDRTLCYLASGKPVVVQDTGPSSFLPDKEGMFRFSSPEDAVAALERINVDYARHCRAAREIACAFFDARQSAERILEVALAARPAASGPTGTGQ